MVFPQGASVHLGLPDSPGAAGWSQTECCAGPGAWGKAAMAGDLGGSHASVPLAEKLVVVGLAGLDLDGLHCGIDLFFPWDSQVLLDLFLQKGGVSPFPPHPGLWRLKGITFESPGTAQILD